MIFQTTPAITNIRQAAVRYTARQPAISAIAPEINRDNRIPETMPLVRVPTAWPCFCGVASTATRPPAPAPPRPSGRRSAWRQAELLYWGITLPRLTPLLKATVDSSPRIYGSTSPRAEPEQQANGIARLRSGDDAANHAWRHLQADRHRVE